jgi:hypothetical protein
MMKHYNKYLVGPSDKFESTNYSPIDDEIRIINEKTHAFPVYFKTEIIISFLKDHSIQDNWIKANRELADIVTSGTLFTGNIESLFDSCRNHLGFRQGLEAYLTEKIS